AGELASACCVTNPDVDPTSRLRDRVSQLFGWVPSTEYAPATPLAAGMAAALCVHSGQRIAMWSLPGLDIGVIEPPALQGERDDLEPATAGDNRFILWMAGE